MKNIRFGLSLLATAALAVAAQAYVVTLNTTSLVGGGTFYVDFQLNDGGAINLGNNHAFITDINLGGGSVAGPATAWGGVTGDLSGVVSLTDTEAFNEFYQAFLPGSFLSFDLHLTNNFNGAVPDMFGFAILDENLFNLPTHAPGSDQFLSVELNGAPAAWQTYASTGGIPAPTVPDTASTAWLVAAGLAGMAGLRRCAGHKSQAV